jgi:hypothetical protein
MNLQIWVVVFIMCLLGYIIFLHIQLAKKNILIESTVKKLSGIEKSRSTEEMTGFLLEIQKLNQLRSYFSDKLLEDHSINFILENEKDLKIFIHYTKKEEDASNILKNGFQFTESFYKTALPVSKDKLDLIVKHNNRKYFGDYLIVICISCDIVNFYSLELLKAGIMNYTFENVLIETLPYKNENSDLVYQLSAPFIKGYINHRTGEIITNPGFDPWYNSPEFMKNIYRMKKN